MRQDHDSKRNGANADARIDIFQCPGCGGHELRRLRQAHTTSYVRSAVYRDLSDDAERVTVDMLDREDHGGQFVYGCGSCRCPLTDESDVPITQEDDLIAWLKSHQ